MVDAPHPPPHPLPRPYHPLSPAFPTLGSPAVAAPGLALLIQGHLDHPQQPQSLAQPLKVTAPLHPVQAQAEVPAGTPFHAHPLHAAAGPAMQHHQLQRAHLSSSGTGRRGRVTATAVGCGRRGKRGCAISGSGMLAAAHADSGLGMQADVIGTG